MHALPINDLSRNPNLDRELDVVTDAARSGAFVLGPEVRAFELEFAEYLGARDCVGVASGTDALKLALLAVGVGRDSRVAMVANAGMYAAAATVDIGAMPTWVDVVQATATMDPDALAIHLRRGRVDAVVVTHLYGNMADVNRIATTCRANGVPLVEDCAQAAGAQAGGVKAGAWGDCAAFSFYPTKNLGAWGDAGAVATKSTEIGRVVRELRQYGWTEKYVAERARGINSRMDELQAALLRFRLPRLDEWNARRREICRAYANSVNRESKLLFSDGEGAVGHLAVLVLPSAERRTSTMIALNARGVSTSIHYPIPDHFQEALASWVPSEIRLPVTEALAERVLTIPCFPAQTDEEILAVCDALASLTA